MTIGFKARVRDVAIASYRYRVLAPIAALKARGQDVELYDEAHFDRYEAVLFSKAFLPEDQRLAERLIATGKRVLLDLCDNMFFNPKDLPEYHQVREDLLKMIALSDRVICSTDVLADIVRDEAGLPYRPAVAPDPYEQAAVESARPTPFGQPARLLWFGRFGTVNAPSGISDLASIRHALADAYAKRPFELTVCSDSRKRFDKVLNAWPVPTRYVEWSPQVLSAEMALADAVVIPLTKNPFISAKTHNRLTLALSAGVPVIADSIDAYREFERFCYLDDWPRGLEAVLLRPDEARARARGARQYLDLYWSMEAIAPAWERALGLPEPDFSALSTGSSSTAAAAPARALAWLGREGRNQRPWLLAGSEADPAEVARARAEGFLVMALGEGAARFAADVAFAPDIETVARCGEALEANAGALIMPTYPHVEGWASSRTLAAWTGELPALQRLAAADRLFGVDLWTGRTGGLAGDLGEEAPLRMLVEAGVRMARHLGVRRRAAGLSGFEAAAPFMQTVTGGVARLRRTSGLSYGPYGYPVPARIFVGADDAQLLGARVLDYSVQKHSTMDVKVEVLDFRRMPVPKDPKNRSKTGFSFCRFDIPRLCGYEGRAVYVDADMQVFADVTDLWTLPLDAADILCALSHPLDGRVPQTSVMLLNCAALPWRVEDVVAGLDEGRYGYKALMQRLCIHPADRVKPFLPHWWNSLERYEPGRTCLIHYTDMPTQPWVFPENKNGALWYAALAEAVREGFIAEAEIDEALAKGHVSPHLRAWAGLSGDSGYPAAADSWVAPYRRFTGEEAKGAAVAAATPEMSGERL